MLGDHSISRRTVLQGLGAAVALPWLEAMLPRQAMAASLGAGAKAPLRMAFLFVPNGKHMEDWTPREEGTLGELPSILQPLKKHREQMLVLSGLTLNGGRALGDGPGDHARCVASFLTGAHPRKTDGKNIRNGPSIDQVAAGQIGHLTRFPSLELGVEPSSQGGRCDSGYSCIYTSNMSWRTDTSPMSKEINPRAVFDRLFGGGNSKEQLRNQAQRDQKRKSILDFVAEDAGDLNRRLGKTDQQKLDEYLYAVRQIERRISEAEKLRGVEPDVPDYPRPEGVPRDFAEHARLMMDMMVLAMQTDSTRIMTFMFTNAGSNRSYRQVGVSEGHHDLSHHGGNRDKQAKISKIDQFHTTQLAYFLDRLAETKELDGTLLDHSMVLYGSGLGDGNRHNHDNLPIMLAGKANGTLKTGRHVKYDRDTPLTNLYRAMLTRMGVKAPKFSDSTGELSDLT